MKTLFVLLVTILTTGLAIKAKADSQLYESSCNSTVPLTTYEACTDESYSGRTAIACAYDNALDNCRTDISRKNQDCNQVGKSLVESKVSITFIGYKYCKATIYVRGWQ